MRGGWLRFGVVVLGVTVATAACGGSGSTGKASSSSTSQSSSSNSTGASGSGPQSVKVDVVITGDSTATIKGTKGQCSVLPNGAAYSFTGADYPDLGTDGALSVRGPTKIGASQTQPPSIKMIVQGRGYLSGADVGGIQVSPDGKKVTLDLTLSGRTHITGTITCT